MRLAVGAAIVILAAATGCGRARALLGADDAGASETTSTPFVPATALPDGAPFGPAVLHPRSCPADDGPRGSALPGCAHCAADERCREENVHGTVIGTCAKSECRGDGDCKNALCSCSSPTRCVPGNCRDAADCGGRECAFGQCRTASDTCARNADCRRGEECASDGLRFRCRPEIVLPPG